MRSIATLFVLVTKSHDPTSQADYGSQAILAKSLLISAAHDTDMPKRDQSGSHVS